MGLIRKVPGQRIRNGLLQFQEFLDPSVSVLRQAQEVIVEEAEPGGGGEPITPEALQEGLSASLARSPIDTEEVRGWLTLARDKAIDWPVLFEESVRKELAERPYRLPEMPPPSRVAPLA
ncbi:MAG: hypothetical protein U0800_06255 [Isosphaeraceae bacterium]